VQRRDVEERLAEVASAPSDAWRLLKSIERDFRSSDRLNLATLTRRLSTGAIPAEVRGGDGAVIVSTIHRAKGLDFDNVVLVNARQLVPADATAEDFAVAYVALTRAKSRIVTAVQELPPFLRIDARTKRWFVGGHQAWMTKAIECRNGDFECAPEGMGAPEVTAGAAVTAKINRRASDLERPVYDLTVGDEIVGRSTARFGELLALRLGGPRRKGRPWPDLTGLAVDSKSTVVSLLPRSGQPPVRVGIAVSGFGELLWEGA
jgi:hypothetical protein